MKKYSVPARFAVLLIIFLVADAGAGEPKDGEASRGVEVLKTARHGLQSVTHFLRERPELVAPNEGGLPDRIKRQEIRAAWQRFLDHLLTLDVLGRRHDQRYHATSGPEQDRAFRLSFAAFLAQYRYALEFIALIETNPKLHPVLNESIPELGLPQGTYAKTKFRFLSVVRATELVRLQVIYRAGKDLEGPLREGIEEDLRYIWSLDQHRGPTLTLRNAMRVVHDTAFTAWFPVQKGVSEWMGDTRVWRAGRDLVSEQQIRDLQHRLRPGDILLVRREWYLSNIGLPGFWPHAALYIGTPEERARYFDDDTTQEWVRSQGESSGKLESLLEKRESESYVLSHSGDAENPVRVIEAISEGVSFTTLEHAAGGDSVAVLRPRLPKTDKARAIMRALHYAGRPYDFDFNFLTDSALVCTELVYKAYEPSVNGTGLVLPIEKVLGRPVMPANSIARLFDSEYGHDRQQFDFIAFLDGNEKEGEAIPRDINAFRESWQRPKWHILVQGTALARN